MGLEFPFGTESVGKMDSTTKLYVPPYCGGGAARVSGLIVHQP